MTGTGGWALTAAALARLRREVAGGRERVVECGSGESTIAIGQGLAARGSGSLHSLEHDPGWAADIRRRLAAQGLDAQVTLIEAPLRPHRLAEPACGWYDAAALASLPPQIDLLLVDGPPGGLAANGEGRYPALPLLAARLAPGALVILDDVHRAGELRILRRWQAELDLRWELHPAERIAIGCNLRPEEAGAGRAGEERM